MGCASRSHSSTRLKYSLQAIATVAAPTAYSRTRSQPMIQADQLAHRRVGIGVGAAGDRNHRRELGVAEPGERAADAGDEERERHRRARAIGDRRRGADEETGADDGADAQRDERPGDPASA